MDDDVEEMRDEEMEDGRWVDGSGRGALDK
jgi:hypothetical protein